jgi:hypothetical protein
MPYLRLGIELAIYLLAVGWWVVLRGGYNVGSDFVHIPGGVKRNLTLGVTATALGTAALVLLRIMGRPGGTPVLRRISIVAGSVSLAFYFTCLGCGVFVMWFWN